MASSSPSPGPLEPTRAHLGQEALVPTPTPDASGASIGPYKLLQKVGEGGMGTVYLAEQTQPVRRRVAVKVIKPGMDSAQVVARFEAERQALALMEHPNIARVLDAGTAPDGRPYFVMELVQGVPITAYCDKARLAPRERLELVVPVCQAVQHAHQKGIIHRDLKPSNILVSLADGKPVPKVIDFGVAKATEQSLTERTMVTQIGAAVGTFEYMSPEQAEMGPLGVDTRSDIYSLGVVLYELLTGSTPLEARRLSAAGFPRLVGLIVEEEPPRPSARLSGSTNLPAIAAARKTDPAKLPRMVRGELDWIVMKCLEKDRTRRYESASGLARDIERYLHDEPVEAGPPSVRYKLRKFLGRHKGKIIAAQVFFILLVTAIAGMVVLRLEAIRERRYTDRAHRDTEAASQVIVQDLMQSANYWANPDPDLKLRPVLDEAVRRIDDNRRGNLTPNVEQAVRMAFGRAYLGLGEYQEARRHAQRAWELGRRNGETHIDTLIPMLHVAVADRYLGRPAAAEPLAQRVLEEVWVPYRANSLVTLEAVSLRAVLHHDLGRPEEGDRLLARCLEACRAEYGETSFEALVAYGELVRSLLVQNKADQAAPLADRALAASRHHRAALPQRYANYLFLAGSCQLQLGQVKAAQKLFEESLAITGSAGPDFGRGYLLETRLGAALLAQNDFARAEALLREGHEKVRRRRTTPFWEQERDEALKGLVHLYEAWGKPDEADRWRKARGAARPTGKPGPR